MSSLLKTASWVIVRLVDNKAVYETYNESIAKAINTSLYKAVPVMDYLQQLNKDKV
jgi:hypothetical protein